MYVLLAKTVYSVLRNSGRIPIYLHRKSNHIFITVWQHMVVLLTIKQYERKSYRTFAEWSLVEAHYFRIFLQLSKLPYFSTLQKFADRINNVMLGKIISSFVVLTGTGRIHIFVSIDSTGFNITRASQYLC